MTWLASAVGARGGAPAALVDTGRAAARPYDLRTPPAPLTRAQRGLVIGASAVAAVSRLLARGHSMWDWDEALFSFGVRDYNVVQHQPHPPGYPLFILAAKIARLGVHNDFRALQLVVVLAGAALLPLVFAFAREARFPFGTALGGALIFVFLPNVWIYSGSALSDVPALALTLAACALLLRGCRSRRAYVAGALTLGLAMGIRPQALMVGAVCGAVATVIRFRDDLRVVVAAAIAGATVVAVSYAGAALASDPPSSYIGAVRIQSKWVHDVDSYHNPYRPPLRKLAKTFLFTPVPANAVEIVSILAIAGLLLGMALRRWPSLLVFGTFAPLAVFTWVMLDGAAVTRYAISYMPMHALLAADALAIIWMRLPGRQVVPLALSAILAGSLASWTWPATKSIRAADAPPVAAIRWVMHNAYPGASTIFVHNGLNPYAAYFLTGYDLHFFEHIDEVPYGGYVEPGYILMPDVANAADAHPFLRKRDRLWRIVRPRGFEASVMPAWDLVRYGRGWHDPESDGAGVFRWMARSSEAMLPPCGPRGTLRMKLYVPLDAMPPPTIEVAFNGAMIDRFVATTPEVERTWTLPSRDGAPNVLQVTTSGTIVPAKTHPGGDARELGLKLLAIAWQPAKS